MPAVISIVIALIAVAVAIGAWFRPAPKPETPAVKTYSEQEVADAKKAVCDAFLTVHNGVRINTGRNGGTDPTATLAVAANARLSLYGGGGYMSDVLEQHPATPKELADAVNQLSEVFRKLAIGYLADVSDTDLEPSLQQADNATVAVKNACQ
ncbi:hypothetical protein ACQ86B_24655 [Mycolicibacterium aichiense]|uniref:hypothetical protein n=1 Tax=Mycolicibacterium aichiense TaxID=1799 RepID=UPI003D67D1CC